MSVFQVLCMRWGSSNCFEKVMSNETVEPHFNLLANILYDFLEQISIVNLSYLSNFQLLLSTLYNALILNHGAGKVSINRVNKISRVI